MLPNAYDRLDIESLEHRLALAGNVAAAISGNTLTITGDDFDNIVNITQVGAMLHVEGVGGTLIQGAAFQDFALNGGRLNLDLRGGADVVTLGDGLLDISVSSLSINTGAGADSVSIQGLNVTGNANVNINLGANTEADSDLLTVLDSAWAGNVSVRTGGGSDIVVLGNALTDVNFRGLSLDTGAEADVVTATRVNLTGTGSSSINLGANAELDADILTLTTVDIAGALSIRTGDGDDLVTTDNVTVDRNLSVDLGAGGDTLNAQTSLTVHGSTSLRLGDGDNTVNVSGTVAWDRGLSVRGGDGIDDVDINAVVTTSGNVSVSLYDGNDLLNIDGTFTTDRSVTVNTSDGIDDISIDGLTGVRLSVTAGSEDNAVALSNVPVSSSLSLYGGTSVDDISLNTVNAASTYLALNGGNDIVNVNGLADLAARTRLTIFGGSGDETLNLSNVLADRALVSLSSGTNALTLNGSDVNRATLLGGGDVDNITVNASTMLNIYAALFGGDDTVDLDTFTITERVFLSGGFGANVLTQNAVTLPVDPNDVRILNFA